LYGGGDPPRALIDAQTGEVIASIDRELDPPFVPPIDIPEDGEEA
jgi:hypothetical protein